MAPFLAYLLSLSVRWPQNCFSGWSAAGVGKDIALYVTIGEPACSGGILNIVLWKYYIRPGQRPRGGRNGHVASSDGIIDLELRTPKEMGGESGYSNPEQLFAAGYAACFDSAMTMLARRKRLDVEEAEITVEVEIGKDPADGGFKLQADITGTFPAGITDEQAGELMEAAHGFCPYSKAVRGNIEVRLHHRVGR